MTDIVERLREQPTMSVFANIGDMVGRLNHEREEAADEIERLREEVWLWTARCHSAIGLLPDEMIIGEIQKAAREAETKIERLREALRGVIRVPDKAALDAARAALGEKE